MSRSTTGSGPVTRASGSHARIGWSQGGGIVAHDARTSRGVVGNANDAVEPVAHLFDVRDENDLRETIAQTTQQREYVLAAGFVEGAEDLVQHQEGERLPRALGDHLRDRETQDEIRDVLFPPRDHRLWPAPARGQHPEIPGKEPP